MKVENQILNQLPNYENRVERKKNVEDINVKDQSKETLGYKLDLSEEAKSLFRGKNNFEDSQLVSISIEERRKREEDAKKVVELGISGQEQLHEIRSLRANKLSDIRESGKSYNFEDTLNATVDAYATLYLEIVDRYADGQNERWVADGESGIRKLTQQEEVDRLNIAYEEEAEWQASCAKVFANINQFNGTMPKMNLDIQKSVNEIYSKAKQDYLQNRDSYNENKGYSSIGLKAQYGSLFTLLNKGINYFGVYNK